MQNDSGPIRERGTYEPSVLVVGSANMDLVVTCDRFPAPGETVFGTGFNMYPGGKGANQAVACARLGARVHFVGKMGNDIFRDQLVASLKSDGVVIDRLKFDSELPTGIATITVDRRGQNEIVVTSGSNMALEPSDVDADEDLFERVHVVLLQLEVPLQTVLRSARLAKHNSATVILNPAPAVELPDELLEHVDILTPNQSEAELLTGLTVDSTQSAVEAAERLIGRGAGAVVVTMGEQGSMLVTTEHSERIEASKVRAVDTTAAGDAFNGALAYSIATGLSLAEAVRFAGTAGSYAATRLGAQPSMPTLEELKAFESAALA